MRGMNESMVEEARKMLLQGITPHVISRRLSVPLDLLLREFHRLIGEDLLRRSDVLFSIPAERRTRIRSVAGLRGDDHMEFLRSLKRKGMDELWKSEEELLNDIRIVLAYGDSRVLLGDMYEEIRAVEVGLYEYVERKLKSRFGDRLEEWWVQGVPVETRVSCAERQQRDALRRPWEAYLDLIDLSEVIQKAWQVFEEDFKAPCVRGDGYGKIPIQEFRRQLLGDLRDLNEVRNIVMHPISRVVPEESGFECAGRLRRIIIKLMK